MSRRETYPRPASGIIGRNPASLHRHRSRGFGLIEIALSVAALAAASAGGVALYGQASDNRMANELVQGITSVRAVVVPQLDQLSELEAGAVNDRLGIERLPGFGVDAEGRFIHQWAEGGVTFAHLGNGVVRFSLDGVDRGNCTKLATRLLGSSVTPGYKSYMMVDDKLFDGSRNAEPSAVAGACADGSDVGILFARTAEDIDSATDPEVTPDPVPVPEIPGPVDVPPAPEDELGGGTPATPAPGTPDPVIPQPEPAQHVDFYLGPETWPGGWGSSPGWGPTVISNWIDTQDGGALEGNQWFRIWGDGNPTIQMANGSRAAEGILSPWGTNIELETPPCGGTSTVYVELENGLVYAYELTRPDWPSDWGSRPSSCN